MTSTTADSMNFIGQINGSRINAKVPKAMKQKIRECAKNLNMTESAYIKLAVQERLQKDTRE